MSAPEQDTCIFLDGNDPDFRAPKPQPVLINGQLHLPAPDLRFGTFKRDGNEFGMMLIATGKIGLVTAISAPTIRRFIAEMTDIADRIEAVAFEASQAAIAKAKAARS
tara:strand:+ start:789 stop:1112 length:324 start_codon:yes stop_codon:yes gene_type:complete